LLVHVDFVEAISLILFLGVNHVLLEGCTREDVLDIVHRDATGYETLFETDKLPFIQVGKQREVAHGALLVHRL